ncbi:ferredoxin [Amycolatopsis anabasis]|uniref:ferredoxin n=1 Tax=Amycolatopsis anabasis TaxID=1840409 RepID=UPI001FE4B6F8|nr:ferredoxin [Amycolatopsis anabasis]
MLLPLLHQLPSPSPHDAGIRQVSALSARLGYAFMCLALSWGVLTATGWVHRVVGRQAVRGTHLVFVIFTLAFGVVHAAAFLFLEDLPVTPLTLTVPLWRNGPLRHAAGILGLELMTAVAITAALRRCLPYRRWLRLHQLGYPAVGLTAVHSWLGAAANGHLPLLSLGGVTLLAPAATLTFLRFVPAAVLTRLGLVEEPPAGPPRPGSAVRVSVDNQRCRLYGICRGEAPGLFWLSADGRLRYRTRPNASQADAVFAAARSCPMQAIQVSR